MEKVSEFNSGGAVIADKAISYDKRDRVTANICTTSGRTVSEEIEYKTPEDAINADERISQYDMTINDNTYPTVHVRNTYDTYKRFSEMRMEFNAYQAYHVKTVNILKKYYYNDGTRPYWISNTINSTLRESYFLEYDSQSRITQLEKRSNYTNNYVYDDYGQLTRENSAELGNTFVYTYDNVGNITKAQKYAYTTGSLGTPISEDNYVYNASKPDTLTSFNGKAITYDANGCVKTYDGWTYTWTRGKLTAMQKITIGVEPAGTHRYTFAYDAYGRRTGKYYTFTPKLQTSIVYLAEENISYKYDLDGRLVRETRSLDYSDNSYTLKTFDYLYNGSEVVGVVYDNGITSETYYYDKNTYGDVIKILDIDGTAVVQYKYDAYGNCVIQSSTNTGLAQSNPFRYRGYYYDVDTGLYYLNARYYNPEWRRFISPDDTAYLDSESVNGLNLYAYCGNDPVNYADPSGHLVISTLIIGALIGATIGFAGSVATQLLTGDGQINWWQVGLDTLIGGISGALGASTISKTISIIAGGALGFLGSLGGSIIAVNGDMSQFQWGEALIKATIMGALGAAAGAFTGAGMQNAKAMTNTINAGKSWGSKAFLTSASEVALRPNSGLMIQTMYINMSKAILKYKMQAVTNVSIAILGTTFLGNL